MITWKNKKFYKDGEEFKVFCGAMHYFRTMPEQWYDRLLKLKCMGFNTVETYCCWNMHEPNEGEFCFEGLCDVEKFLLTAKELGLYVIVRPGPYICGEWEFGGLPAWLLKDESIRLRTLDPIYLEKTERYMKVLLKRLVPHLESNGGNIILMAVENEYGSFGSSKEYKEWCTELLRKEGVDVPFITADGGSSLCLNGGMIDGAIPGVDVGYADGISKKNVSEIEMRMPDAPIFYAEHWIGCFSHWGRPYKIYDPKSVEKEVRQHLEFGNNFNLYMYHGGTNWGFYNGANLFQSEDNCVVDDYFADITSYDYDAVLTEWGGCTEKYFRIRDVMQEHLGYELPMPPKSELQNIGDVELTKKASLFDNLNNIGNYFKDDVAHNMEHYGQNLGYILYRCEIKPEQNINIVVLKDVRDRSHIYFNGIHRATIDRNDKKPYLEVDGYMEQGGTLEILVENQGRVNYGINLLKGDRKGILDCVYICGEDLPRQILCDWEIYTLPMSDLSKLSYAGDRFPAFFTGTFKAEEKKDCFIHLENFTKGFVVVNGFNLGRFWNIGPQLSLYLPWPLLKDENEITVFEEESVKKPVISIRDYHILSGDKTEKPKTVL